MPRPECRRIRPESGGFSHRFVTGRPRLQSPGLGDLSRRGGVAILLADISAALAENAGQRIDLAKAETEWDRLQGYASRGARPFLRPRGRERHHPSARREKRSLMPFERAPTGEKRAVAALPDNP